MCEQKNVNLFASTDVEILCGPCHNLAVELKLVLFVKVL